MSAYELHLGDCLEVMKTLPANSIDSIVTDPPAGINFMNMKFDSDRGGRRQWIAWMTDVAAECLRLLKPGGHALVWALPRTSHWTATAWEDAGFEIRDCVYHIFGSGFPKSMDISKAIDKAAGAERQVVGVKPGHEEFANRKTTGHIKTDEEYGAHRFTMSEDAQARFHLATAPATDAARQWDGWGTALKPSVECWWLLRKPLSEPTIAANALRWNCGALNIDACRIGASDNDPNVRVNSSRRTERNGEKVGNFGYKTIDADGVGSEWAAQGRWPANLILDEEAAALLDEMSGERKSGVAVNRNLDGLRHSEHKGWRFNSLPKPDVGYGDTGGASRFFYVPKASRRDRDEGLEGMPEREARHTYGDGLNSATKICTDEQAQNGVNRDLRANFHPTVKSTPLMRWLVRLVTPPGGVVLDPFLGSGSTLKAAVLEGFNGVGIDTEAEYLAIATKRLAAAAAQPFLLEVQP